MAFIGNLPVSSNFGSRLGADIAQALQGLAQKKANNLKVNQNQQFLQSLGIRPDVAQGLAHQPDDFIQKFLGQYEGFDINNPVQQQYGLPGLQENQPNMAQSRYQKQPQSEESRVQKQPQVSQEQLLKALSSNPELASQISPEQVGQLLQNQATQQALNPSQKQNQPTQKIQTKAQAEAERKARVEQLKQLQEEKVHNRAREEKSQDESRKYLLELNKETRSAKDNDKRLGRMEELIKTGKLSSPSFHNFLNTVAHGLWGVGLDLHYLESPESQEFTKISNDFVKGIKDIFGARITNLDVDSYMKTIPTLSQTNEGKERIIQNLKISNQAIQLKDKIAKDIVKQNNNVIPGNLELLVEEVAAPQLDELAARFVNNTAPTKSAKTQEPIDTIQRGLGLNKLSLLD